MSTIYLVIAQHHHLQILMKQQFKETDMEREQGNQSPLNFQTALLKEKIILQSFPLIGAIKGSLCQMPYTMDKPSYEKSEEKN